MRSNVFDGLSDLGSCFCHFYLILIRNGLLETDKVGLLSLQPGQQEVLHREGNRHDIC